MCPALRASMMRLLDLIRRQKVAVEVSGDVLVVTMPGTGFSITYEKTEENRLVANSFHARTRPNEARKAACAEGIGTRHNNVIHIAALIVLSMRSRLNRFPQSNHSTMSARK
jgi:hypothetical protein